jgi:hypothetical protein
MTESKKGIHQISPNSFLFFNTPELMYYITLEIIQKIKIKLIIIKIAENTTNIYDSIFNFSDFGTGDKSAQDTIKNLDFIIYNYNFIIKEDKEKVNILINTSNPCNLELSLHKFEEEEDDLNLNYKEQIKNFENKIKELMDIAESQEQEIFQLNQKENINLNKINTLNQQTEQLIFQLEERNRNNQYNNNQYNNHQYNGNPNNNNYNQNQSNNNFGNTSYMRKDSNNLYNNNRNNNNF